jgi:hypothetical protein
LWLQLVARVLFLPEAARVCESGGRRAKARRLQLIIRRPELLKGIFVFACQALDLQSEQPASILAEFHRFPGGHFLFLAVLPEYSFYNTYNLLNVREKSNSRQSLPSQSKFRLMITALDNKDF